MIIAIDLDGKLIAEWENCERAAKALNINRMAINNCVNNKTKTSNNFIWKRK